jgi:CheY-like chemotaxis protein
MNKINCILLVDDNPGDNFFNSLMIEEAGISNTIRIVQDGREALSYFEKIKENSLSEYYPKPDMVFLDINMPMMNGFEFLQEFQKLDEAIKAKVVIMLTTSADPEEKESALALKDVKEYITKPLDTEILKDLVSKYFNGN